MDLPLEAFVRMFMGNEGEEEPSMALKSTEG